MTRHESVIEWKFAAALRDFIGGTSLCAFYAEETMEGMTARMKADDLHVVAAAPQVRCGRYRVDFLFVGEGHLQPPVMVAVECDGHDFHERTKEQARRDKSRDRELAAMGVQVLRYTGSEIVKNAKSCVVEAAMLVSSRSSQAWAASYPDTVAKLNARFAAEASA
jgi:very-short-patch-repair endonuclease